MKSHRGVGRVLALGALIALAIAQTAASWPSRPLCIIAPFAPGGTSDLIARMVAEGPSQALAQPVVVENKAGPGDNLGAAEVARAVPDGYTLMLGTPKPILDGTSVVIDACIKQTAVAAKLRDLGAIPVGGPPQRLAQHLKSEQARFADLIAKTGLKPE